MRPGVLTVLTALLAPWQVAAGGAPSADTAVSGGSHVRPTPSVGHHQSSGQIRAALMLRCYAGKGVVLNIIRELSPIRTSGSMRRSRCGMLNRTKSGLVTE